MRELDRWALARLHAFLERCRRAYERFEFHVVYHALNNFCSVDLSALYFDIVKDRLYCDGAASESRRAVQTVMYDALRALAGVVAPILSFTAEEIWREIPGGPPSESVFLSDFPAADPAWRDDTLAERWVRLWEIRGEVTRALEEERKAGRIGHSLDARVRLVVPAADHALVKALGEEEFAAICIVSQLESAEGEQLRVDVENPRGVKCSRCWIWSESVGAASDHPELCSRCHSVVTASS